MNKVARRLSRSVLKGRRKFNPRVDLLDRRELLSGYNVRLNSPAEAGTSVAGQSQHYDHLADFQATDPNGVAVTSEAGFKAIVNWNDGEVTTADITPNYRGLSGLFDISGDHGFPNPSTGEYSIQVQLTDPAGGIWYARPSIATVEPRPDDLVVNPIGTDTFSVTTGQMLQGAVATIQIANPNVPLTGLTGVFDNGDETQTPAQIVAANPGPGWVVTDPHSFIRSGTYIVALYLNDKEGDKPPVLQGHVTVTSVNPTPQPQPQPQPTPTPTPTPTHKPATTHKATASHKAMVSQKPTARHQPAATHKPIQHGFLIANLMQLAREVFVPYHDNGGPIQIARVLNKPNTYIVMLSGTEPFKALYQSTFLKEDIAAEAGLPDAYYSAIAKAIHQYIPLGANVILAGHSLGAMESQNIVSDSSLYLHYHFTHVIGFGSPKTNTPINKSVSYRTFNFIGDEVVDVLSSVFPKLQWSKSMLHQLPNPIKSPFSSNHLEYPNSTALSRFDALGGSNGASLLLGPITRVQVPSSP